jgi:hypothetical protein
MCSWSSLGIRLVRLPKALHYLLSGKLDVLLTIIDSIYALPFCNWFHKNAPYHFNIIILHEREHHELPDLQITVRGSQGWTIKAFEIPNQQMPGSDEMPVHHSTGQWFHGFRIMQPQTSFFRTFTVICDAIIGAPLSDSLRFVIQSGFVNIRVLIIKF